jgi:hypothetical protein
MNDKRITPQLKIKTITYVYGKIDFMASRHKKPDKEGFLKLVTFVTVTM